ncbi:flavin-containing monooxygenase [Nitriliruptor alkaliphilus]|uniref:flavin-containing monooxygenase n=1 Tax=Nitriliruptor alkaliphilus TaxID=427918 RepID=UPI0009F8515A|nr:NAD(P)/FAD-dependent oxidoreductase [Nitriliruptor alkaliphilus]
MTTHAPARPHAEGPARTRTPRVGVIGTGFSGVAIAAELQTLGIHSFTMLEKADEIGGVWRDNTYPGAACDVPSHLYAFSWKPESDWSLRFAPQAEIHAYLQDAARERGLLPHIRFGVEVVRAVWSDTAATWHVHLDTGEIVTFDVLVAGTGQLNRPAIPALPGIDGFTGLHFHSARWDHAADLEGRDMVVIGTGASAIQFVPHLAETAQQVTVVQRSAPWVVPKADRAYSARQRATFARVPGYARAYRAFQYLRYESRWPAFSGNALAGRAATAIARRHMESSVHDPELRERLTPDHPIGCKRILQSNDWYPALARPNVDVVDGRVTRVEADAVVLDDGTRLPCDTIVWGTGFKTTEFLAPIELRGRGGTDLNDAWRDGAEAHLGITVAGFPNLFLMYGPNTNLGHNSIIFMLECQARYIGQAVARMAEDDLASIEVREDVHRRFNDSLQRRLQGSVWAGGCDSWYVDEHGRIVNNWAGTTLEYRWRTRRFVARDHLLVRRRDLPTGNDLAPAAGSGVPT